MKKITLFAAAGLLMLSSCDLDINENPNYPSSTDVSADLVFPSIENSIADVVGDQMFNYAGFFAQYWGQMPTANQYNVLDKLDINEATAATPTSMPAPCRTWRTCCRRPAPPPTSSLPRCCVPRPSR